MSAKETALKSLLAEAARRLGEAGLQDPRREARLLACWALDCDAAGLWGIESVPPDRHARFLDAIERRCRREPLAFITGTTGFWTLDIRVSPATLIPRGDSETLIEALLAIRPDRDGPRSICDLGTGTGCLLLAALSEYPQAFGVGVDLSPDAAHLARENSQANGLQDRAAFVTGSWADSVTGPFDMVLSNPPYIEREVIAGLMPEVRDFEPGRALDGGIDGLDAYRHLTSVLPALLKKDGIGIFELGVGQARPVTALAEEAGLVVLDIRRDLGGVERAITLSL